MARFVKGDVVVIPFPFSDLTQAKRRPAVVVAQLDGNDLILVQVTSQTVRDGYAIQLDNPDFETGSLHKPSNIRPNRVFTADNRIILYKIGELKKSKTDSVIDKLIQILKE